MKNKLNNDGPKTVFKFVIEQLDNGTSRHLMPRGVPLEAIRNMLFTHMMLIEEQIITIHIEEMQKRIKLVKPNQLLPSMKLRQ